MVQTAELPSEKMRWHVLKDAGAAQAIIGPFYRGKKISRRETNVSIMMHGLDIKRISKTPPNSKRSKAFR